VTDWVAIWRHRENDMYKDAFRFWSERIGNMEDEAVRSRLAEVSPINFAASIRAPLLLVHGKRDTTVPLAQSESLVEALARTNHPAKALFFSDLGHRYPDGEQGTKFLTEVEQFLGNHLGATR
jgi:dipeptidyl aminopeptidase/acylaminoacyl peptidase